MSRSPHSLSALDTTAQGLLALNTNPLLWPAVGIGALLVLAVLVVLVSGVGQGLPQDPDEPARPGPVPPEEPEERPRAEEGPPPEEVSAGPVSDWDTSATAGPENPPPAPRPEPPTGHTPDRFSVVLGNATLLGIGYMLMRRPRLAMVSLIGSVSLLALIALYPHVVVWRLLLPVWWVALVVHSWLSAPGGRPAFFGERNPVWLQRVIAAACLMLVSFAWLRLDTWTIVRDAETPHADGDCERAVGSLRWLSWAHGTAYGSLASRGESEREACELLLTALDESEGSASPTRLGAYLDHPAALWEGAGPRRAELLLSEALGEILWREVKVLEDDNPAWARVEEAFAQLSATLQDNPGQSEPVSAVVESFLADLAEAPPCKAKEIDTWLLAQTWEEPELAALIAPQADQLPTRMFYCAGDLNTADADAAYQEFLTDYPEHELAVRAAEALLSDGGYCDHPAAYPGAAAYEGGGPHAMWMLGMDPEEYGFPDSWLADAVDQAALVVCVEGPERGSYQQTCYYETGADQQLTSLEGHAKVDFYASEFTVKAYELRTGELVEDYSEEVGDPCPGELQYTNNSLMGDIVPSTYDSDYTDADVRSIFDRLMD